MTLSDLNALSDDAARRELSRCCGSRRWVAGLAGRRPFQSVEQVCALSDELWWSLEGGDWLEAFSHHPRIGERSAGWSRLEQSGVNGASGDTLKELARLNQAYERKFGHVFLVSATGKSADDMLVALRQRVGGDPATELKIAAGEQAKITRLRLENLLRG